MEGGRLHASPSLVVPAEWASGHAEGGADSLEALWAGLTERSVDGGWLLAPVAIVFPVGRAVHNALAASFDSEVLRALLVHESGGHCGALASTVDVLASLEGWVQVQSALVDAASQALAQALVVEDQVVHLVDRVSELAGSRVVKSGFLGKSCQVGQAGELGVDLRGLLAKYCSAQQYYGKNCHCFHVYYINYRPSITNKADTDQKLI